MFLVSGEFQSYSLVAGGIDPISFIRHPDWYALRAAVAGSGYPIKFLILILFTLSYIEENKGLSHSQWREG